MTDTGDSAMRYFYWSVAAAVVLTVLVVLLVPGLDDFVQQTVLRYVSGAAR